MQETLHDDASASRPSSAAQSTTEELLHSIQDELRKHSRTSSNRGYISELADLFYRKDERSFKKLEEISMSLKNGTMTATDHLTVKEAIENDRKTLHTQNTISGVASSIAKVAPLFMQGRIGWIGTIAANALEQMNPHDSFRAQLCDGALGGTKGALMKGTFALIPNTVPSYAKGAILGSSSRLLESGLNRNTYIDSEGKVSLATGLSRTVSAAFSPGAVAVDAATFAISGIAVTGINAVTRQLIPNSPILSAITTSSTMGFSTGASTELFRQRATGETTDVSKIFGSGLLSAFINGVAAIPGGIQSQMALNAERRKVLAEMLKAEEAKGRDSLISYKEIETKRVLLDGYDVRSSRIQLASSPESATLISKDKNGSYVLKPGADTQTTVNGKPVNQDYILKNGDVIKTRVHSDTTNSAVDKVMKFDQSADEIARFPFDLYNHIYLGLSPKEHTYTAPSPDGTKILLTVGSRTNTTLNGKPLNSGDVVEVKKGDKITTQPQGRKIFEPKWEMEKLVVATEPVITTIDASGRQHLLSDKIKHVSGSSSLSIGADLQGVWIRDYRSFPFLAPNRLQINGKPFLPTKTVYIPRDDRISLNGAEINFIYDESSRAVRSNSKSNPVSFFGRD